METLTGQNRRNLQSSIPDSSSDADRAAYTIYALTLAVSIALWFLAIRAPLDIDETGSYWQICAGIAKIWPRQFLFPASAPYSYILWFWSRLFGTSEIVLRIPSVLAMLGAVYLLYRSAREMFDRESALFAAVVFSLHPLIHFASIDVHPYAFAALAINAAIFILLRLRHNDSNWLAALFGLSAACIVWFQFLFGAILPVLVVGFFAIKLSNRRTAWRQFGVALAVFVLVFLPSVPELLYLIHTGETHAVAAWPFLEVLVLLVAPALMAPVYLCFEVIALLVAKFSTRQRDSLRHLDRSQTLLCAALGLVPALILFGVSLGRPVQVFIPRYTLVSVPGIALCWGLIFSRFRSRLMRLLLCISVVAMFCLLELNSPSSKLHDVQAPWKYALEVAERNAQPDNAPVLICSGVTESDFAVMPTGSAKTSPLFAPLSYYPISVPVVPLPMSLNSEAMRDGSHFLQQAAQKHQRFLAVGYFGSYKTLEWIEQRASTNYTFRKLRAPGGFEILEFLPRNGMTEKSHRIHPPILAQGDNRKRVHETQ